MTVSSVVNTVDGAPAGAPVAGSGTKRGNTAGT